MLRLAVLALLLANAAYFAWSHGLLAAWGFAPAQQAEPQRIAQQIRPEAVRVLAPDEARRAETAAAAASRPAECLQAGLFDDQQTAALRLAVEPALAPGTWTLEPGTEPARWIVYMGKYPNAESVARKRAELRQLGVSFEPLANPALEPGLSLGGFDSQAAATQHLERLAQRGVRTAKVQQERPEVRGQVLKLPSADDAQRARLDELKPLLAGKALRACR